MITPIRCVSLRRFQRCAIRVGLLYESIGCDGLDGENFLSAAAPTLDALTRAYMVVDPNPYLCMHTADLSVDGVCFLHGVNSHDCVDSCYVRPHVIVQQMSPRTHR